MFKSSSKEASNKTKEAEVPKTKPAAVLPTVTTNSSQPKPAILPAVVATNSSQGALPGQSKPAVLPAGPAGGKPSQTQPAVLPAGPVGGQGSQTQPAVLPAGPVGGQGSQTKPAVLPAGPVGGQGSQAQPAVLPAGPGQAKNPEQVAQTRTGDSPSPSIATKPFFPPANSSNAATPLKPEPVKLSTVIGTSGLDDGKAKPKVDAVLIKRKDDPATISKGDQTVANNKPKEDLNKPKEDLTKPKEPQHSSTLKDSIVPPITKDAKPDFVARMFVNMARKDDSIYFNVSCLPPVATATLEARQAAALPQQNAYIRSGKVHVKSEDGSVEAHLELAGGSIERATKEGNGVGPVFYLDSKTLRMDANQAKPQRLFVRCNLAQYLCKQTPCTHETTGATRLDLQSKVFFVDFDKGETLDYAYPPIK